MCAMVPSVIRIGKAKEEIRYHRVNAEYPRTRFIRRQKGSVQVSTAQSVP